MNETLTNQHYENLAKVQKGEISQKAWYEFCANILGQIMMDNADVLKRLKER